MIITVTMNPALDKTVEIDEFHYGGLNRLSHVTTDVGGKGINVSKTISALGGSSIATGFLAGNKGYIIEQKLREQGIQTDFIFIEGENRTNLKLVEQNGILTELNEAGPAVTKKDLHQLEQKLKSLAGAESLFIFSGSILTGISVTDYCRLLLCVKQRGSFVFLDADGAVFAAAIAEKPDMVKPNQFELKQYFHIDREIDEEETASLARQLQRKGIGIVAVSMGEKGAVFVTENRIIRVPGLKVKTHSTVGASDAMLAAFVYAYDKKYNLEKCIRYAIAASAGAVMTTGTKPPAREVVEELMQQIIMHSKTE